MFRSWTRSPSPTISCNLWVLNSLHNLLLLSNDIWLVLSTSSVYTWFQCSAGFGVNTKDIYELREQVPWCLGRVGTFTTLLPSAKMYFNIIIVDSFQYVISIIAAVNYKVNCLCTSISSGTSKVWELHIAQCILPQTNVKVKSHLQKPMCPFSLGREVEEPKKASSIEGLQFLKARLPEDHWLKFIRNLAILTVASLNYNFKPIFKR